MQERRNAGNFFFFLDRGNTERKEIGTLISRAWRVFEAPKLYLLFIDSGKFYGIKYKLKFKTLFAS